MRYGLRWYRGPVFAPEGDGAAPPSPNNGGAPAGGDGKPAGGEGTGPFRPEGLPDHLFGTSDRETVEKLFTAYKPARDEIAKFGEMGKLPKDADGYAFEPSDKLKPFLPDFANDPVLKLAREAAHKAGIRDKQFGPFVSGILEAMIDGEMVTPAIDLAKEKAALLPEEARGLDQAGQNTAIDKRVRDNHARIEIWKSQGLPAESATALAAMLDTAAANHAVEFFAKQMRTAQPTPGGGQTDGVTHESVKARQQDPRNRVGNAKYDPAFAAETNRMYQTLFPS
jgi:hypothetical protein